MKSHIESMYYIETGRRWKNENPGILLIVISFAWRLLDIFEKCTENENLQIFKFTVFTIFSLQKHEIYQKPSKFYSLYSMT